MFLKTNFICLLAALGLCCYRAVSSCGQWGLLSSCHVRASCCSGFSRGMQALGHVGFMSCELWAQKLWPWAQELWTVGSVVAAPRLWSTGSIVEMTGLSM